MFARILPEALAAPVLAGVLLLLSGCTATPQIRTQTSDLAVQVKAKVPAVTSLDLSPDGKSLLVGALGTDLGGTGGTMRLWDLQSGRMVRTFSQPVGSMARVTFLADGKVAAASSRDVTRHWDLRTGQESAVLDGKFGGKTAYSGDGRFVLGYVFDFMGAGKMRLRDVASGKVLHELRGGGGDISSDGRYIAAFGVDTGSNILFPTFKFFVDLIERESGRVLWSAPINTWDVKFSPDGTQLLVAQNERPNQLADQQMAIKLFDVASGRLIREFGRETVSAGFFSVAHVYRKIGALAFAPDGKTFVSGDLSGQYKYWDIASGALLRTLKSVDELGGTMLNAVPAVEIFPDGRTAVANTLASTRIFDLTTGNELATLITYEDGEWLITTPDGYYSASEQGDQRLNVTVAGRSYSISQVRESFNRPELVKLALAGRKLEGQRKVEDVKPPPQVAIVETPAVVDGNEVMLKLRVADQGGGIGDVRVYLNGTAVVQERISGSRAQSPDFRLRLVSGVNRIRAIAFNADNSMQSSDANHQVDSRAAAGRPALHALVIGIQDYENPRLALNFPAADARLIAKTLRERAADLFDGVTVTELTTRKDTTKDAITQALRDMSGRVRPDDLFVFFVASHGTVDDGSYYLITSNVGATSSHILKQTAMNQDELKQLIANVPATKKLIMIDTCNAGRLGEAIQVAVMTRGMSEDTALKILARAVGSTVLSASTSLQEALEGYKEHGLFSWVVAEGLAGAADSDRDGFVKTHELVNFVDTLVPDLAERVFKHKQYPTTSLSGQGFPVSRARQRTAAN